ncbi:MAG: sigma D regulator [Vibrio sp.]
MLNKLKRTQAQFGGSSDVIDHWLETRQDLIVEYWKVAGVQSCQTKKAITGLPTPSELQDFCQHLVDYISEGHFKIYDRVMREWQATGFTPTKEIDETYFKIVATTEPILDYTDKYAEVGEDDELAEFNDDLSKLGEVLEDRFEREDELIQLIADSLAIPPGA